MDASYYLKPLLVEAVAIAVIFSIGLASYRHTIKLIRFIEERLARLGERRMLSGGLVALVAFALSATLSLFGRIPEPGVHDEFSYLLAADTFAHGRLSNPTHPMWIHFETFHVIHQPTYASKYPPGQGLALALGQLLAGHPIIGAWITTAIACAAVYWMLIAWVPAWLAILGGIMTALHPGVLFWSQMYYGGQLAMIGGALVFGAFRRLVHEPRVRDTLLLGLGLVIFANSRPYEGLVASIPLAIVLLLWMASKNGPPLSVSLRKVALPIFILLAVSTLAMGYYNWQVTGSPIRLPYVVHEAQYDPAPSFVWQHPRNVPTYRHKVIQDFYNGWSMGWYYETLSLSSFLSISLEKLQRAWVFFQGMSPLRLVLFIPLLMLPRYWGDRWFLFLLVSAIIFASGLLTIVWAGARLSAPITGVLIIIYVEGLRRLRIIKFRRLQVGRLFVWALTVVAAAMFIIEFIAVINDKTPRWEFERARILRELADRGGRHLVIVRYGAQHSPLLEWVYNEADIDAAKVVWARQMAPAEDKKLIEYFKDRKVWLLDDFDDSQPPTVTEYHLSKLK
jgi:hypothetical protein